MSTTRIDELDPRDDADLERFRSLDSAGPTGPPRPLPEDARPMVAVRKDGPEARCTIRAAEGLAGAPGRTGIIGHYEARDRAAGVTLLREALARLAGAGVERVIGPMDGTTWDRYRLALPRPDAPAPFLTEPVNPPDYPAHFEAAGLAVVARYVSQVVDDLDVLADRGREAAGALAERGIRVTSLALDRFDHALEELYALSIEAFALNPYYAPIAFDRFRGMYEPMRELLDPELVLIARGADDAAVGFALSFPDLLDPAGRPTRVVLKSLAVARAGRGLGLGSLLMHEVHQRAAGKGYGAVIHALMHEDNDSLRISRHGGAVFRHYALYGWSP